MSQCFTKTCEPSNAMTSSEVRPSAERQEQQTEWFTDGLLPEAPISVLEHLLGVNPEGFPGLRHWPASVSTRSSQVLQDAASILPSGSQPKPETGPSWKAAYRRLVTGVLVMSTSQMNPWSPSGPTHIDAFTSEWWWCRKQDYKKWCHERVRKDEVKGYLALVHGRIRKKGQ